MYFASNYDTRYRNGYFVMLEEDIIVLKLCNCIIYAVTSQGDKIPPGTHLN
jgi:hypothetical protein